ncbi:unnamed protein product [Closterium sp. Naga37s-1]|nr:unnamed protein product [Closterium sp. Naga37s-1]
MAPVVAGTDDRQVQVRFTTRLPAHLTVPSTPFTVPVRLTRYGLSEVINTLLGRDAPQPFDFIVDGRLLRSSLRKCLLTSALSTERVIPIEYTLAVRPPSASHSAPHDDWVSAVSAAHPSVIVTGSYDSHVRLFSVPPTSAAAATPADATAHAAHAADAGSSGARCIQVAAAHSDVVTHIAALPAGSACVSASKDRTLRLWQLAGESTEAPSAPPSLRASVVAVMRGHTAAVQCAAVNARANKRGSIKSGSIKSGSIKSGSIKSGSIKNGTIKNGTIKLCSLPPLLSLSFLSPLCLPLLPLSSLVSPPQLASGGWDSTIKLWTLPRLGANTGRQGGGGGGDGSAGGDGSGGMGEDAGGEGEEEGGEAGGAEGAGQARKRVRTAAGAVEAEGVELTPDLALEAHTHCVAGVAWPAQGSSLFSVSWDHSLRAWDVEAASAVSVRTSAHPLLAVAAGGGGMASLVAVGGAHPTILLWDMRAATSVLSPSIQLLGHTDWISSLAWSPSNPLHLLSSSYDGSLKIWDLRSTPLIPTFP